MSRLVLVALVVALTAQPALAQSGIWPLAVERLELSALAGDWYEVAATGSWSHRRCLADTRFRWTVRNPQSIELRSACTTRTGEEVRKGQLRAAAGSHRGRLAIRFAPAFLAWLPAAWSDFWVLAVDDGEGWLLIGNRQRSRLSVLSRFAMLDEASFARALRVARVQGFDVDRLTVVPHGEASRMPVR